MKTVVAYTEPHSFEPIREELLSLGFLSLPAWKASGAVPELDVFGPFSEVGWSGPVNDHPSTWLDWPLRRPRAPRASPSARSLGSRCWC